ncbi:MAG: spore coat protein CotJB [Pseudoflavonifractor sp.]
MISETRTLMNPNACGDANGTLPACAPLAVPYVPFQETGAARYPQGDALNNGTLFPGLNLPFRSKVEPRGVAAGHLAELQSLEFVLLELGLYLDTHPADAEAFEVYKQYATLEKEARGRYETIHGPLMQGATVNQTSWSAWQKDPWPWNLPEGGAK